MTKHEMTLIAAFLNDLSRNRYGNDGCNEIYLEATPENVDLVNAAYKDAFSREDEEVQVEIENGKFCCINSIVVDELKNRLMKEFGIDEKDLPEVH